MWMQNGPIAFTGVAGRGIFAAYDLKTNRIVWEQQWPQACLSGSIVTRGGLVFTGRSDGRLTALDKTNGRKLWEFGTDAGVNATVSTFEYRGRQYVAMLSAGALFGGGKKGDSVWLLSLAGKIESLPIALPQRRFAGGGTAPAANAAAQEPIVYAPGEPDLANGKVLYQRFCVACHGAEGLGGHGGGAPLNNVAKDEKLIIATATTGKNQNMPPFRGALKPEELRDIAGYVSRQLFGSSSVKAAATQGPG
jgi:mono/diheme cytochrome c family protein